MAHLAIAGAEVPFPETGMVLQKPVLRRLRVAQRERKIFRRIEKGNETRKAHFHLDKFPRGGRNAGL